MQLTIRNKDDETLIDEQIDTDDVLELAHYLEWLVDEMDLNRDDGIKIKIVQDETDSEETVSLLLLMKATFDSMNTNTSL